MAKNYIRIPLAGNAYLESQTTGGKITPGGISEWSNPDAKFGVYVRFAHACTFDAAIKLRSQKNNAKIRVNDYEVELPAGYKEAMIGTFTTDTRATSASSCRVSPPTAVPSLLPPNSSSTASPRKTSTP